MRRTPFWAVAELALLAAPIESRAAKQLNPIGVEPAARSH
jgi:hypothetical protein